LTVEGETELDSGWRIQAHMVDLTERLREEILEGKEPYRSGSIEVLSIEGLPEPLTLRPMVDGDAFQPLGMQGSMKVSDFFINEGIRRGQRMKWPLLTTGDDILWVVGLRLAHPVRIREDSRRALKLELLAPDS
jgi:tRNA(Ile)-lysidine synthase